MSLLPMSPTTLSFDDIVFREYRQPLPNIRPNVSQEIKDAGSIELESKESDLQTGRLLTEKIGTSSDIYTDNEGSKWYKIPDWKNYYLRKGNITEIVFDVSPVITKLLKGSIVLLTPLTSWADKYRFNPSGFVKELINRALVYPTNAGLMKNKIKVNWSKTGFSPDLTILKFRFEVIENSWPVALIVGAILAGFIFLSVREVRILALDKDGALEKLGDGLASIGLFGILGLFAFLLYSKN